CTAQQFTPDFGHNLLRDIVLWARATPGFAFGDRLFDLTASRNHGTLTNMGFTSTSGWSGTDRFGGHAQVNFDGTDDYVTFGNLTSADFANATFSVSVWFRATAAGYIVAKRQGTGGGANGGWFIRVNSDGTVSARQVDTNNTSSGDRTSVSTVGLN